jgi:ATP-binding cassette subfamily B protein
MQRPEPPTPPAASADALPSELLARMNGQLDGQAVVAWSEYDLDDANRYAKRYAVLTERQLITVGGDAITSIPVAEVSEAKITEGLGVDRLRVLVGGKAAAELRYTHRHRRGMVRLHRKLERRLPKKDDALPAPDWLDAVEREAEKSDRCPRCGNLIPAYAEGVCPNCQQTRKILWRLLDVARPYRTRVWVALGLTLCVSTLAALPAIFNRYLIDDAILNRSIRKLFFWSGLLLATVLVSEFLGGIRTRILAQMGTWITRDLRHKIYAHLQDLSLRYFAKRRTGSLITRVTNDTDRLWDFIVFGSVDLVRDLTMIAAISAAMFWLNWKLALVALMPLPPLGVLTYYRSQKMQRMFGRLWTYWSRLTAVVGDALPGVKVIKAFANEGREVERFDRRSEEYSRHEMEIHDVWVALQRTTSALMRLGALLIWVVGGWLVIRHGNTGDYTVGMLVSFTSFVWQFYQPIMELANSNRMVTRAATSAQRVFEVLDTPPDIYSKPDAIRSQRLEGRVEFRQVSFSYEGTAPALREITLSVEPGEMIGLCGPSGAGKSTFVNLICRFYDVTDGQILIDGVDVRDYDVKWLRRQVGIVLQEPYLFHGTIAENIAYGHPEATPEQIIEAAKAANAHDFVVGFPDGYDTMVGERGQSLSGGERQRISIARAILDNPRILILDEATSSVDSETEKQIQQALDRLVAGRTTFAIAHRLSTLQAADRLVVLEKGKIVEQGTHAELVDKGGGVYAKLHKTQMELATQVAVG